VLKEAYDIGALAALADAGLVKEAGAVRDAARVAWEASKRGVKSVGESVRNTAAKLRAAQSEGGVGRKFLEGYPSAIPAALAKKNIPAIEKTLLEQTKPWLASGAAGLGAAGLGYGAYKGLQALFPDADASRFNSPFGNLLGDDD
jgi:hypothetical protein